MTEWHNNLVTLVTNVYSVSTQNIPFVNPKMSSITERMHDIIYKAAERQYKKTILQFGLIRICQNRHWTIVFICHNSLHIGRYMPLTVTYYYVTIMMNCPPCFKLNLQVFKILRESLQYQSKSLSISWNTRNLDTVWYNYHIVNLWLWNP